MQDNLKSSVTQKALEQHNGKIRKRGGFLASRWEKRAAWKE